MSEREIAVKTAKVLLFICEFIEQHGMPPTMREIADGVVEVASTSTVRNYLISLEKMGLIERQPNKARSIKVVDQYT